MVEVVGVRFKEKGKIYYFSPQGLEIEKDAPVIVETARGLEYGYAVVPPKEIEETEVHGELKNVIRLATEDDYSRHIDNRNLAREALLICQEKIQNHNLEMRLISSEYTFDNSKLLFYFTAEGRVDFRDLVRDLASVFRTRIELRQIGVRDEAKILGGLGMCGRECCCHSFLSEFAPVTIKMAKDQGLSLNPTNISGICGRLLCCLRYEQDGYEEILKKMPRQGSRVISPLGEGLVIETYNIQELVKIKIQVDDAFETHIFPLGELRVKGRFSSSEGKACGKGTCPKAMKARAPQEDLDPEDDLGSILDDGELI